MKTSLFHFLKDNKWKWLRSLAYKLRKKREANNWWGTWDEEISIDSLVRHAEDLQAIHAGLYVYKVRDDGEETVVLPYPYEEVFKGKLPDNWELTTKEDCYNAMGFYRGSGILEHLKTKK